MNVRHAPDASASASTLQNAAAGAADTPSSGKLADALLIVAALLFGSVSVLYPFGGDQGLYYYVGREWLTGAVPYRDVMEQKTPLIFVLHAVLVFVTGPNMWAVRVAELGWLLLVGVALAELAAYEGERRQPGTLGLACFSLSVSYFGLFNYWDTAQCEIWYAGLAVLSLWVIARGPARRSTWLWAGALGGLALLMKPPAALLIVVVVAKTVARAWSASVPGARLRGVLEALSAFGAGAAAPIATVVLYFACAGALEPFVDLAFRANYHDMVHSSTVSNMHELATKFREFSAKAGPLALVTFALALLGFVGAAWCRHPATARRYAIALALFVAAAAAVTVQRKFYGYHWGILAPVMAFPLVCWAADLRRSPTGWLPEKLRWVATPAALAAGLLVVFAASDMARPYARTVGLTVRYLTGGIARQDFLTLFTLDENTPYAQQEAVGRWIAENSAPDDLIAVRGFDQTIYAIAHRRAPTRFFWTRWLTEPRRAYRRRDWVAEDADALRRDPPRYVVVGDRARRGPSSAAYFESLGYSERFRNGRLIVLERR